VALRAEEIALDTSRLVDVLRDDAELADRLERCARVCIPLFVFAEITAGFLGGNARTRNQAALQRFLRENSAEILLPDLETAEHFARLFLQLRRAGQPIPVNDLWIAALCLQHRLTLITRDRHFESIPQLLTD